MRGCGSPAGDRRRTTCGCSLRSEFESQPIAALEAVSLGVPLVVADNSGQTELATRGLAFSETGRRSSSGLATHQRKRRAQQDQRVQSQCHGPGVLRV